MSLSRWPALLLALGLPLVLVSTSITFALVPEALRMQGAILLQVAVLALTACYTVLLVLLLRRRPAGDVLGATIGIVAGVLWCAEIFGGGPAWLAHPVEVAVGATAALLATASTLAAGPVAAAQHRGIAPAWRAGLYAGLVSGLIVFVFAAVMTLSTLGILGSRADYRAEFARSAAPSMHAYIVQDVLGATLRPPRQRAAGGDRRRRGLRGLPARAISQALTTVDGPY